MLTFLFWNLSGKSLIRSLVRLASEHQVDVLMLTECPIRPYELLPELNPNAAADFHYAPGDGPNHIEIYTRFPGRFLVPLYQKDRLTIRRMALPAREELLLAVVHMPSKLHWSNESQMVEATVLSGNIQEAEQKAGHQRTLLVGDMNMNPFEAGMVAANGLHAMMTRQITAKKERMVQSCLQPYFYNPMWGHFGDATGTPPGTFYYPHSEQVCYFWNMFDQVLLRPELLSKFANEDLRILTTDGEISFTTRDGLPNRSRASDHLPIVFTLQV